MRTPSRRHYDLPHRRQASTRTGPLKAECSTLRSSVSPILPPTSPLLSRTSSRAGFSWGVYSTPRSRLPPSPPRLLRSRLAPPSRAVMAGGFEDESHTVATAFAIHTHQPFVNSKIVISAGAPRRRGVAKVPIGPVLPGPFSGSPSLHPKCIVVMSRAACSSSLLNSKVGVPESLAHSQWNVDG